MTPNDGVRGSTGQAVTLWRRISNVRGEPTPGPWQTGRKSNVGVTEVQDFLPTEAVARIQEWAKKAARTKSHHGRDEDGQITSFDRASETRRVCAREVLSLLPASGGGEQ